MMKRRAFITFLGGAAAAARHTSARRPTTRMRPHTLLAKWSVSVNGAA